jgi:hypothetical protein
MGCDIHFHAEIKINGEWHHYNSPRVRRWYALFSKMANVRNGPVGGDNYDEPIDMPRGFPDDASVTTRCLYEFDGCDAHTPSWLTREEAVEVIQWFNDHTMDNRLNAEWDSFGYLFGNGWNDVEEPKPEGYEDARWVFWFDN